MRPTSRVFATVKSASKYLEPNIPTGLTGLSTHPCPRPALLYTYNATLSKLKQLPASSVYRQSCEALTKHRLAIIEATKPEGYEAWLQRVNKQIEGNPQAYGKLKKSDGSIAHEELYEGTLVNWDGEQTLRDARAEGSNTETEAAAKAAFVQKDVEKTELEAQQGKLPTFRELEIEPALTAEQVNDIEQKLGAGLIEEVVQVAEGELLLVDEMVASRAWEDLEEKTPPGQWEYFDRGDRV